jgi:hypothetical protein
VEKIEIVLEYSWKYSSSWPYNGMVNDLWRGVQANENYLVALGLFSYSEILGRNILNKLDVHDDGLPYFKEFTIKYVGYKDEDLKKLFDSARNGLSHRYFMKHQEGTVYNDQGNLPCGYEISATSIKIYIHTYFKHFVLGLEKYLDEKSFDLTG